MCFFTYRRRMVGAKPNDYKGRVFVTLMFRIVVC